MFLLVRKFGTLRSLSVFRAPTCVDRVKMGQKKTWRCLAVLVAIACTGGSDGTTSRQEAYWAVPDSEGNIPEWKHLDVSDLPTGAPHHQAVAFGAAEQGIVVAVFVEVTDNRMDVRFISRVGMPLVNAVRITHRPDR